MSSRCAPFDGCHRRVRYPEHQTRRSGFAGTARLLDRRSARKCLAPRTTCFFPGCLCRLSWPVVQKIAATSAAIHLSRPRFRGRSTIYLRTRKSGDRRSESSEPTYRWDTHRASGSPATRSYVTLVFGVVCMEKAPEISRSQGRSVGSLAVTYSGMPEEHTTIGVERLHFRVR